jgi:hypothetical protein
MTTIATASLVSHDRYDQSMYQQAFHGMEFAIGSPVGTRMVTTNEDFLETSSVLETN